MMIALWKPRGPTSHDIVNAVRRITGERRVGHAGTLDPLASGVLVMGIGRESTRTLDTVVRGEKEYIATIRLGATSTTDDAEGTITAHAGSTAAPPPTTARIADALRAFVGRIAQTPPVYSAVKLHGTPAHRRMRRGETVILASRMVDVHAIDVLSYAWPELQLRIVCGAGVYIRAIARDLGHTLGVGGYLTALERTRVGIYTSATAQTVEAFAAWWRDQAPHPSNQELDRSNDT
ncbi:tRNA pseudouridine(55) synthase TruB [Candidatus Uhrbacteria bacterium]|nr:tRNA pseudouridine(55) synthase TruB [Candidatus Uhrbacteria bacterium]